MIPVWPKYTGDGIPFWFKTSNEIKDYFIDWSDEVAAGSITTSTWTIRQTGADLVNEDSTIDDVNKLTNIVLSGGVDEVNYEVINTITVGALVLEKKIIIKVRDL